jgi:hypothetical protein
VSNLSLCLGTLVAETPLAAAKPFGEDGSIKNNKLCKTNPISKKPKMNLTIYLTKDYGNETATSNAEKQTQSNPIYGEQSRTHL